jgi:hypothetical protein
MAFVESTHTQEGFAEHVVLLTRNWHAPVAQVPLYQMQSPEATGHDSRDVASEQAMLAHVFIGVITQREGSHLSSSEHGVAWHRLSTNVQRCALDRHAIASMPRHGISSQ